MRGGRSRFRWVMCSDRESEEEVIVTGNAGCSRRFGRSTMRCHLSRPRLPLHGTSRGLKIDRSTLGG